MNNSLPNEQLTLSESNGSTIQYSPKDIELSLKILTALQECKVISKEFSDPTNIENLKMNIEQTSIASDKEKVDSIIHFLSFERGLKRSFHEIVKLSAEYIKKPKPSLLDFLIGLTTLIHGAHSNNFQDELRRQSTLGTSIVFGGIMVFVSVVIWAMTRCRWHT